MKKMNNKGFLLVETIVVATFTLTVLIALFIQFKNLLVSYNSSYNYNTVEGIYNLNAVKTYIMQNQNSENPLNKTLKEKNVPYITLYSNGSCMPAAEVGVTSVTFCEQMMTSGNFKTVVFSHSNPKALKEYLKTNEDANISEEMKNLIKRLETVDGQNRLIAEFNDGTLATIVFGVDNYAKPVEKPKPVLNCKSISSLKENIVTEKDGLYSDSTEEGRYVYKGTNPNNYITFNGQPWRILAIEQDGTLKIMKAETIEKTAWHTSNSNKWDRPANINNYLNNDYYNTLTEESKKQIQAHDFNTGGVTEIDENLQNQIKLEKQNKWNGNVGLLSLGDFIRANTNTTECGSNLLHTNNNEKCKETNYLVPATGNTWTITPIAQTSHRAYYIRSNGAPYGSSVNTDANTHPVVFLNKDLRIAGEGVETNPYIICNEGGAS